jgi:lipoprotein-anchoring transpeptidase ErfK/SrfK
VIVFLVAALASAPAGCGHGGSPRPGGPTAVPPPAFTVTPGDGTADVPVSAEIEARGAKLSQVRLTDGSGRAVTGTPRPDGTSWVPDEPLDYTTTYTATVVAKGSNGASGTRTVRFTTMSRPGNRMTAHLYMSDNATYGRAMPLVIEFGQGGVPQPDRAAVQRRLFVASDPPQQGAWHWDGASQVEYRPREYWKAGTRLHARLALGGLPVGGGRYGQQDLTIDATMDTSLREVEVDNTTKQLVARQDGQVVKTMPVSLGRPDKPSFSGAMVVMERLDRTTFDSSSYGTPVSSADGYRTEVQFAERLTWDGQFIHAAPWSVDQQGHVNVSHGCVNVSTDNAQWLYNWLKVGDPVVVKGTEQHLPPGNGWTAWDLSWDDFTAGSAQ